jgi:hypothetical protein
MPIRDKSTPTDARRIVLFFSSRPITPGNNDRDDALKVFSQNLLDYMPIAFMWGISRYGSVRVD